MCSYLNGEPDHVGGRGRRAAVDLGVVHVVPGGGEGGLGGTPVLRHLHQHLLCFKMLQKFSSELQADPSDRLHPPVGKDLVYSGILPRQ